MTDQRMLDDICTDPIRVVLEHLTVPNLSCQHPCEISAIIPVLQIEKSDTDFR